MTSDKCSNEVCECGHRKIEHTNCWGDNLGRTEIVTECMVWACPCKRFTPSPKSNSQQERTSGNIGNVDLSKTNADNTHTLAEIEQRIRKEIEENTNVVAYNIFKDTKRKLSKGEERVFKDKVKILNAQLSLCKEFRDMIEKLISEKTRPESYNEKMKIINLKDVKEIVGIEE